MLAVIPKLLMIGRNVSNWLKKLEVGSEAEKNKSANHLLGTSELYFDDKKVTLEERLQIINTLIKLQNNSTPIVRQCIVYLIGILKTSTESVNTTLTKMLMDENEQVQISAVWASGNLGKESSPLIPTLISLSEHSNKEVRQRVPWALKEIAVIDNSLSDVLIEMTKDKDSTTRMYALDAIPYCISEINRKIEKVVRIVLKSKDESAGAACRVIQKTTYDWKNTKRQLFKLVKKDNLEAVLAICIQWPEMVNEPIINKWLKENSGYWWAEDLLNGDTIKI